MNHIFKKTMKKKTNNNVIAKVSQSSFYKKNLKCQYASVKKTVLILDLKIEVSSYVLSLKGTL